MFSEWISEFDNNIFFKIGKPCIKAGEELFLDYQYDPFNCPDWFLKELDTFIETMTEYENTTLYPKYVNYLKYLKPDTQIRPRVIPLWF